MTVFPAKGSSRMVGNKERSSFQKSSLSSVRSGSRNVGATKAVSGKVVVGST